MKNFLLSIFALLVVGCGAYLWANSLLKKERQELLNGTYELVDWQIRPTSIHYADSLVVCDVPRRGERITVQSNEKGDFRLAAESALPLLQQASDATWKSVYTERSWFTWRHRVMGFYAAGSQSARVYWHRMLIHRTDVGLTIQLPDPKSAQIGWLLTFKKAKTQQER